MKEGIWICRKVIHRASGMVIAMKQIRKAAMIKEEEENMFGELKILRKLEISDIEMRKKKRRKK